MFVVAILFKRWTVPAAPDLSVGAPGSEHLGCFVYKNMSDDSEKEKGNAAFRRGDYATALKHYNKAIETAGSDAGAALFSNKAAALIKLEKYDLGIEQCRKGLAAPGLTPELKSKINLRMVGAYESMRMLEEAMEAIKKCNPSPAISEKLAELRDRISAVHLNAERVNDSYGGKSSDPLYAITQNETRSEIILKHNIALEQMKQVSESKKVYVHRMGVSPKFYSGHVCTSQLSDLKPIFIDQLRLDEVNVGRVLICRTLGQSYTINALYTVIEDAKGGVLRIAVYNTPDGSDGIAQIRVNDPEDLIYLDQPHFLLSNLTWRTAKPTLASTSFEKLGNEFFVAHNYEMALRAYDEAIEQKQRNKAAPTELADLLANRAAAYLADDKPADTLWDCRSALYLQPGHLKATFRMAKAHAALASYEEAKDLLEKSPHTTRPDFKAEHSRLNHLIREQKFGDYDLKCLMKEAAASKTPRLDHADYNAGVQMQWVSNEKGNGLVALRDFAPGDLLYVSKAFVVAFRSEFSKTTEARHECYRRILLRLLKNKDHVKFEISDLPTIDPERIRAIVSFNAIGTCDFGDEPALFEGDMRGFDFTRTGYWFAGSGLWLLASFMNHSCVPNTDIFYAGDLMLVRAAKRIRKGEELTMTYLGNYEGYAERQALLGEIYGFKCECSLCLCDLQRASDLPNLERLRKVLMDSYNAMISRLSSNQSKAGLDKYVEDTGKLATEFYGRFAYKDRYDSDLQILYKALGTGHSNLGRIETALNLNGQRQFLRAAKAFEMAYVASAGEATPTDDTFSYNALGRDTIFLCFRIAENYAHGSVLGKAKEYLGKMLSAAIICYGSDDMELLEMLYPELPLKKLIESLR